MQMFSFASYQEQGSFFRISSSIARVRNKTSAVNFIAPLSAEFYPREFYELSHSILH